MKLKSLKYLSCPSCKSDFLSVQKSTAANLESGHIVCSNKKCRRRYFIRNGLANLTVYQKTNEKKAAASFGYEWQQYFNNKFEKKTVFGRDEMSDLEYFFRSTGTRPSSIKQKRILDAGCGSSKLTALLSNNRPEIVIGFDIHDYIKLSYEKNKRIANVEIVQANIFNPPFKRGIFDIVWCNGVVHHTPDPYKAFLEISKLVKKGGRLYVWGYEKRFSPFKFTKDIFRFLKLDRLPYPYLKLISSFLAVIFLWLNRISLFLLLPFKSIIFKNYYIGHSLRKRNYDELTMTWFDALSPKYDYRFREEEIVNWFLGQGYKNIIKNPHKIGICGTKS